MDTSAGVAAIRGGSLPMTSASSSRKQWSAISDPHSGGNSTNDMDLEQLKHDRSDERTIYEHRRGPADVDFSSITMDGPLDDDILSQRLRSISRQKEELHQLEIELRVQIIARNEIMEMQRNFEARIKEHANASSKLQEQLHEKEKTIRDLERKLEEKERELHAIKLDNEAAWAKEDLLREQNNELATFRRERNHSEAERAQHIQQIHELQDHFQEKERQLAELQKQDMITQEATLYKDEQLREAQAWIARAQELDALQSSTNHSLQAELRERTEQYNQLWLGFQRQFAEMERLHLHTVQQLQLELANAKGRSGSYTDESHISRTNSNSAYQVVRNSGNQVETKGNSPASVNTNVQSHGYSLENVQYLSSKDDTVTQNNCVGGGQMGSSSLLGMPTYLHSFIMNQQGFPQAVHPHAPSHLTHSSLPVSSMIQAQQYPAAPERSQILLQNQNHQSQENHHSLGQGFLDVESGQGAQPGSSSVKEQTVASGSEEYPTSNRSQNNFQDISSQLCDVLRLDSHDPNRTTKEPNDHLSPNEHNGSASTASPTSTDVSSGTGSNVPETMVSSGTARGYSENALLDEHFLLACIVRTMPAGGRIRISSTLPNRLGKMLAPLHWHDYRRKYGKLDDFVAGHPELFVIEGDYIQVREGAQKMVAASAAAAKVAAAAAESSPHSMYVAVTPMSQTHLGLKKTAPNGVGAGLRNVKVLRP